MSTYFIGVIGFLLGMSFGLSSMQTSVQKRLAAFVAARGLRLADGSGAEVSTDELAAALRKDGVKPAP